MNRHHRACTCLFCEWETWSERVALMPEAIKCELCAAELGDFREKRTGFCLLCIRAMSRSEFARLVLGVSPEHIPSGVDR